MFLVLPQTKSIGEGDISRFVGASLVGARDQPSARAPTRDAPSAPVNAFELSGESPVQAIVTSL
jgi:hypothetical protein